MARKRTVKDVAELAGVSPATVSRVFSRYPHVSSDVRTKVADAARTLGYSPRMDSKSKVIALIIPSPADGVVGGYLGMAIAALSRHILQRGYHMEIVAADDIGLFSGNMICGAVALRSGKELDRQWSRNFSIPLININAASRHIDGIYAVNSNEVQGMRLAVDYLVENGHRRIGLLQVGDPVMPYSSMRCKGFVEALVARGLDPEERLVRNCTNMNLMYRDLGSLLRENVSALICTGEKTGIAVAHVLNMFGKRIPEDVSLISFEMADVSEFCIPPQTTLEQDLDRIAGAAIDLIEQLGAGTGMVRDLLIDYRLIRRDSVKKLS